MKTVHGIMITLEAARVNAGLSIEEAASKLGIDRYTLESWEKHSADVEMRYQRMISYVYEIPIDAIFFG